MVNIGLIGGGHWGKNLIREFNNHKALHTICEINEDLLKQYKEQYPNIYLTYSWATILSNNEITAVCIALPAHLHYKFAKEALLHNKDVYVEKPITLKIEEAEELVELAKKHNKILMVGHLLHYHPCIEKIKELVSQNKIGKILNIVSNRLNLGIFRTYENVLWSFAPHDISVILSLCDDQIPDSIMCHGQHHITKDVHDTTNTILKYNDGKYININVNWLNPYKEQKLSIIGTKGMILFDDTATTDKLKLYKDYINYSNTVPAIPTPVKNEEIVDVDLSLSPLYKECGHFIQCCVTRSKPITDGEEGLRVLKVLNLSQQSLETGIEIKTQKQTSYYVHPSAIVDDGVEIGEGTKIWHFSHICKGAKIGKNCNIGQNVFIAGGAVLGDGCKVQNNVSVYAGVKCGNGVFLGPSCVLTNDLNPRTGYSKNGKYIETIIDDGCTVGANATIVCGNTLGKHCLIGAGSTVTKNVEAFAVVAGNPAKRIGTIDELGNMSK